VDLKVSINKLKVKWEATEIERKRMEFNLNGRISKMEKRLEKGKRERKHKEIEVNLCSEIEEVEEDLFPESGRLKLFTFDEQDSNLECTCL
jgi:hypothetical protein